MTLHREGGAAPLFPRAGRTLLRWFARPALAGPAGGDGAAAAATGRN
ncbi:hypothetical protein [Sinirhodobacter huangdaonensis]|nr:hypothetical protein [Sinirhodobacter huangdaonensis]